MVGTAILALGAGLFSPFVQTARLDDKTFVVDDSDGLGLVWEGVGAISGGGATTKLLYDYPEDSASKVLDMLFTPNVGANLQMLKVEIGGDTDATEGAEPSHMHYAGDENYNRGYEWWLMKEAKKRNPDIKLYGLPWGWPGSLDSQATSVLASQNAFESAHKTAKYTVAWLKGAKKEHGLDIDYVGLWNEKDAPDEYVLALRDLVAQSGLKTKVLNRLDHYVGSNNTPDAAGCRQYANAEPGDQLADEEGSMYDGRSARCLARVLNRAYISKCKTGLLQWHLVSSFYDYLPWPRCGLAVADEPWSGAFEIASPAWAVAHTTQFAEVGWQLAAHGAGVHMLKKGGSMVTRISPDRSDFSIVIEKIDSATSVCGHGSNEPTVTEKEHVKIQLKGAFLDAVLANSGKLAVWYSNMTSGSDYGVNPPGDRVFQKLDELSVDKDGFVQVHVHPEDVYTLTTLKRGNKEAVEPPARKPFPVPFAQTFDDEVVGHPPRMWYDQMGAWEIQRSPYGDAKHRGNVMRQVVPVWPNCWGYSCEGPTTYFGPSTMKGDLTISFDIYLEDEGSVSINPIGLNYSKLELSTAGSWHLGHKKEGKVKFPAKKWHSVALRMRPDGSQDLTVNNKPLSYDTPVNLRGLAGLHTGTGMPVDKSLIIEQCTENAFPLSTKGYFFKNLKVDRAKTAELCQIACCKDENLCDVWQFDGHQCQFGRAEAGYSKDHTKAWVGARRWDLPGWHVKLALSKYMYASIDNFHIDGEPSV